MVEWTKNFLTFLDTMFQIEILQVDTRKLRVPVKVDCINIDIQNQLNTNDNLIEIEYKPQVGLLRYNNKSILLQKL